LRLGLQKSLSVWLFIGVAGGRGFNQDSSLWLMVAVALPGLFVRL
jgi:hypothetical protein